MTPIFVRSTIDVHDDGGNVQVAVIVGFANFLDAKINLKPIGGVLTNLVPKVQIHTPYTLGNPADLITKHIRMILTGQVGDPGGAVQGSFYVVCIFTQNGVSIGSSDPVTGKYGPGDALQLFNITCSFT
jgi:hypothetical protein